jgi:glutamate--cysteine ligase
LRDLPSFRSAFKLVAKHYERVLIEETVEGAVYRFFCLAGRAIAIRYGLPANVEGDGVHSIADLVQLKNRTSADTPSRRRIRVKQPEERMLVEKGMAMSTIPRAGEIVWLGRTSNLHQGADTIDATDTVHPSYIAIVEQAVQRFPGLTLSRRGRGHR